jgi:hypothetical protein
MPDNVIRDLQAFTPVGLDRDAVLFAAGRTTARRWGGWKWVAVSLAMTNAFSLGVLLWPKPVPPPPQVMNVEPPTVIEPPEPYRPDPSSYIALRQGWNAPHRPTVAGEPPAMPPTPLTPRSLSDPRVH